MMPVLVLLAVLQQTAPPRTPPAEAEEIFRRILDLRKPRSQRSKDDFDGFTLLEQQRSGHTREIRLFARAFPDLALKLAAGRLEDPAAPAHERTVALDMLLTVAPRTTPSLEETLKKLAGGAEEQFRFSAVANLGARDPGGKHRDLYRALCPRGISSAFPLVLRFRDGKTRAFLKELAAGRPDLPYPEGAAPGCAARALASLDLLEAPNAHRRIEERMMKAGDENATELFTAFELGRLAGMKNLKEILARRLAAIRPAFAAAEPAAAPTARTWETAPLYDELMWLHVEEGGTPTPFEFARLRHFGFAGDPEERLLELLKEARGR